MNYFNMVSDIKDVEGKVFFFTLRFSRKFLQGIERDFDYKEMGPIIVALSLKIKSR